MPSKVFRSCHVWLHVAFLSSPLADSPSPRVRVRTADTAGALKAQCSLASVLSRTLLPLPRIPLVPPLQITSGAVLEALPDQALCGPPSSLPVCLRISALRTVNWNCLPTCLLIPLVCIVFDVQKPCLLQSSRARHNACHILWTQRLFIAMKYMQVLGSDFRIFTTVTSHRGCKVGFHLH